MRCCLVAGDCFVRHFNTRTSFRVAFEVRYALAKFQSQAGAHRSLRVICPICWHIYVLMASPCSNTAICSGARPSVHLHQSVAAQPRSRQADRCCVPDAPCHLLPGPFEKDTSSPLCREWISVTGYNRACVMHVIHRACDNIVVHHSQCGCFARPADDPAGWVARHIGNPAPGDSTSLNCDVIRQ